jgi:hypothetical protein
VNVLLLFWALVRLTAAPAPSMFVTAMFALHPLNVESVAWIAEKKNLLSTLFFLLTLGAYASYARRGGARAYMSVLVFFALGLASKSMLVTLPFVLLLLDRWPLGRWSTRRDLRGLLVEKIPMLVGGALVGLATIAAQTEAGSVRSLEQVEVGPRVSNALVSYAIYLRRLFWPSDLATPYPDTELIGIPLWTPLEAVAALALVGAISTLVWRQRRTQPFFTTGWLWFLGMLVPVIGLVRVGIQSMADRYMYVVMIGPLIMLGWGGEWLARRWPASRRGLVAIAVSAVAVAGWATSQQIVHWRNDITLFERAVAVTADNWVAMNNLAWKLATCPDPRHRDGERAVLLAEEAVRLTGRNNAGFLDTLAAAYAEAGRFADAIASANEAIRLASRTRQRAGAQTFLSRLRHYERGEPIRASVGCPSSPD